MILDEYGQYQSEIKQSNTPEDLEIDYEALCPIGGDSKKEDVIAKGLFADDCEYNPQMGFYIGLFLAMLIKESSATRVALAVRGHGCSTSSCKKGLIVYVIHVKSEAADLNQIDSSFKYQNSDSLNKIQQGGKSRNYPTELSEVLMSFIRKPGHYALFGIPYLIKSIRLLQDHDPIREERIQYCIGLVCDHLKSSHYAESLARQMGIAAQELRGIDFSIKDLSQPATDIAPMPKARPARG